MSSPLPALFAQTFTRRAVCALALVAWPVALLAQQTIVVTNTRDSGNGSLRAAVEAANSMPGPQRIVFRIPRTDPNFSGTSFYITPENYPSYTLVDDGTVVDGSTQTQFTGDTNPDGPEITLFGSPIASEIRGFLITGNNNVVRGIGGFQFVRYGIEITGNHNRVEGCSFAQSYSAAVQVSGNFNLIGGTAGGAGNNLAGSSIGLLIGPQFGGPAPVGNVAQGNRIYGNDLGGVRLEGGASQTLIGGADPAARNVIYANGHASGELKPVGFHVELAGDNNVLQGNWIGLDPSGVDASGLAADAVRVDGSKQRVLNNVIGGMETYNSQPRAAVQVLAGKGVVVQGNLIGVDPTGTAPRPNSLGVVVSGGKVLIGGTKPGQGNVIAYSSSDGVGVSGVGPRVRGAAVLGNSIFKNGGSGIDLGLTGPTANDPGDADTGDNRLQNHPVIRAASISGSSLTLTYTVDSAPENTTYPLRVEFFRADADREEGEVLLGADVYTAADFNAGAPGTKTVTLDVAGLDVTGGHYLVGTATDAARNTSEFGKAKVIRAAVH